MRILSWNILASEWIKKSYYKDADHDMLFNRRQRFTKITELIREVDADIVMLQEVMPQEHKKLKLLFQKDYIISGLNKIVWQYKSDSKSGNVTLVKRSMFGGHDVTHQSKEYGLYTQCIHNNIHYDIFNIHLDDLSRKKRYEQMEDVYKTLRAKKCVNIIAGDFRVWKDQMVKQMSQRL
jgi:endonuclease/exonuclease/phosphatase family metal-dependent hydrolase